LRGEVRALQLVFLHLVKEQQMTLTVLITQPDDHVTTASVRQHTIQVDKPTDQGGTDTGPRAREVFLMAVGSCFMDSLRTAIRVRERRISDVRVEVVGHEAQHPRRITGVELNISANYEDEAEMLRLVTMAERSCTLTNTLRHSVDITVSVSRLQQASELNGSNHR
jgi:uncharacterized OsmC-like protein